jgi:sporulation protein YlmC with PRC-barrel domain
VVVRNGSSQECGRNLILKEGNSMFDRIHILACALALGLATPVIATPVLAQSTTQTAPAPVISAIPSADVFYRETMAPTHWRISESLGEGVYNRSGERIGEIDDLLIDKSGKVLAAVVGVGGFLGMGEHKVAISYQSFDLTRESNGKPRLVVDISKAALKEAPVYKPVDAAKRS